MQKIEALSVGAVDVSPDPHEGVERHASQDGAHATMSVMIRRPSRCGHRLVAASPGSRRACSARARGAWAWGASRASYRWLRHGHDRGFRLRDTDVEPGAARRLRVDRDLTAEVTHPLAHADEPEPTLALGPPGVEPPPVIDDPQGDRVRGPAQCDLGLLGAAVLDGIS